MTSNQKETTTNIINTNNNNSNINVLFVDPADEPEIKRVSEAIKRDLHERGESILAQYGSTTAHLVKSSKIPDESLKCAKNFASHQTTIDATSELLNQFNSLVDGMQQQTLNLAESVEKLPLLIETSEKAAKLCEQCDIPASSLPNVEPSSTTSSGAMTDALRLAFDPAAHEK